MRVEPFDAERQVGSTLVRASGTLDDQDLEAVLETLTPVDVESLITTAIQQPP